MPPGKPPRTPAGRRLCALPGQPPHAGSLVLPCQPPQKRRAFLFRGDIHATEVLPGTVRDTELPQRAFDEHALDGIAGLLAEELGGVRRRGVDLGRCDVGERALEARARGFPREALQQHLVEPALKHGGHVVPPDGEDEHEAVGAGDELLVARHERIERRALAVDRELVARENGVEAVCMQVDDLVWSALAVVAFAEGVEHRVAEALLVGVAVDDEGAHGESFRRREMDDGGRSGSLAGHGCCGGRGPARGGRGFALGMRARRAVSAAASLERSSEECRYSQVFQVSGS